MNNYSDPLQWLLAKSYRHLRREKIWERIGIAAYVVLCWVVVNL